MKPQGIYVILLGIFICVLIWSGIRPVRWSIWFFEVSPAIILALLLVFNYRRFPLTPFAYTIIFLGSIVMLIGGHYTYAQVPLFDHFQGLIHFTRNHFDRLGHFFQGMMVSVLFAEYVRRRPVVHKKWIPIITLGMSVAFSAGFELFEYLTGLLFASDLSTFLGLQGDMWDAHWDMFWALIGALLVISLSFWHRKQINRLTD